METGVLVGIISGAFEGYNGVIAEIQGNLYIVELEQSSCGYTVVNKNEIIIL